MLQSVALGPAGRTVASVLQGFATNFRRKSGAPPPK